MTSAPVRPKAVKAHKNYPRVELISVNAKQRRWKCSCGQVNKVKAIKCANCGAGKTK